MTADRVAQFEADIAASPDALTLLLDGWPAIEPFDPAARIAFAGLGSSGFAAQVIAPAVRRTGRTAWVEPGGAADRIPPADDLVLIAASASGRTDEILSAVEHHRGSGTRVIGLTNDPGSPLASIADEVIHLEANVERAGIACRSFRATLAAMALVTGVLDERRLRSARQEMVRLLDDADAWAPDIVDALDGATAIDVIAEGGGIGIAEQAALMLREAPRLPAHAVESAEWLHTSVYLAWQGHVVLCYGEPSAVLVTTLQRRGATLVAAPGTGSRDSLERAISESVIAEVVAARLWAKARAQDK